MVLALQVTHSLFTAPSTPQARSRCVVHSQKPDSLSCDGTLLANDSLPSVGPLTPIGSLGLYGAHLQFDPLPACGPRGANDSLFSLGPLSALGTLRRFGHPRPTEPP